MRRAHILIALAIFGLFSLAGFFNQPLGIWKDLELKTIDLRFKIRGERNPSNHVVIAGIEAKSIDAYGRWPWPRSVFAQLIVRLKESGAKTIVFDLLFTEPEENRVTPVIQSLQKSFSQLGLLTDQFSSRIFKDEMDEILMESDNDSLFAEAVLWSDNVIMGMAFESDSVLFPIPELRHAVKEMGFVNVFPDKDGIIRRIKPFIEDSQSTYPSLGLAGAAHFLDGTTLRKDALPNLFLDDRYLPVDQEGDLFLDFYGLEGFHRVSIFDVIEGHIHFSELKDKIVIIGSMATGIGDIWATPLCSEIPGTFIQATFIENILENRFLRMPRHHDWIQVGAVLVMTIVPLGLMILLPPAASIPACGGVLLAYAAGVQYLFGSFQLIWPLVIPLGAGTSAALILLIFNFMVEIRQHRWIKKSFSRYLNPEVIDILVKNPDQLQLGGEEKELTVIMADIRNFTTLSETLSPGELIDLLNRYLGELTEVILNNGGTLDKYMGDAIMAFFGAPVADDRHPQKACHTVTQMCDRLHRKREEWVAQGLPALHFGVGLSTGIMVVGNLGSKRRFDYSVIGDNVNLASRLEGLTKIYGVEVIVSEQTHDRLDETFLCRELDTVQVKGRQAPVRIFELIGMASDRMGDASYVKQFEQGLYQYRRREFKSAVSFFRQTLQLKPEDKPSLLFIQRCRRLMVEPLDEHWDGTWTFTTK